LPWRGPQHKKEKRKREDPLSGEDNGMDSLKSNMNPASLTKASTRGKSVLAVWLLEPPPSDRGGGWPPPKGQFFFFLKNIFLKKLII
jgi:hypothetical protein